MPFILRPERKGLEPWLGVLAALSVQRSGDQSWLRNFLAQMRANGKLLGIDFDFGGEVGNSLDSLRLLWWAGEKYGHGSPLDEAGEGGQERLANKLAFYHFEQKLTVGKHDNLLKAVEECGYDVQEAAQVLASADKWRSEVLESMALCHKQGIHSIPRITFIWGGDVREVCGSAPQETFQEILEAIISSES